MTGSYVLDNAHDTAATRLAILERLYDPLTRANLDLTGGGPNQDVWEVGAGAGSIATWLSIRGARVVVTDIDTRHISANCRRTALGVLTHDVAVDPPPGDFDLIHARLVLSHLPQPVQVIQRLVGALRPGGWLCMEELDPMLPYQPAADPAHVLNRVGRAFTRALASRGGHPTLGRRLHPILAGLGLDPVHTSGAILTGQGGGGLIARLMAANTTQTADLLAEQGIEPDDLVDYRTRLDDPDQWLTMPVFWSARARAARR